MRSYTFSVSFSSAYFSSKEISRAINPSTTIIKVVIKDLERVKEPAMKGDKNLNDSILDSKDTTEMAKRATFLLLIDDCKKSLIKPIETNIVNMIREIK